MTDRPLVSIVTPTLNQGRFIEATINSIRAQTYDHFEHIVVDGGSTDETLDILRRSEGAYNMRWLSEPDNGMYDAVNKGMRLASGEILAYLNSDDLYFPWTLETVVEAFGGHPGTDVVCGDCLRVDANSSGTYLLFQPQPRPDYVKRSGYLAQPTVFWRRRVLDELGDFDASLRYVADCDYWMRAIDRFCVDKVDEFLAVDTIQGEAKRSAQMSSVARETASVRGRYVQMAGVGHQLRHSRNRLWGAAWRRIEWVRFVAASRRRRRGAGPWGRWLSETRARVSIRMALAGQLPVVGEWFAIRAVSTPVRQDPPA